jgi:hypothetical protein
VQEAARRNSDVAVNVNRTASQLSGEADVMGEEVKSFLGAMGSMSDDRQFTSQAVDLATAVKVDETESLTRCRAGLKMSPGMAVFVGAMQSAKTVCRPR